MRSRPKRSPESRFRGLYEEQPNGCWYWIGAIAKDTGYGIFRVDGGKLMLAHCYSFELEHPDIDRKGRVVRHTCDEPRCVNPSHLLIGSHAQNSADMDQRGRRNSNPVRGEAHYRSKLTQETVDSIRRMSAAKMTVPDIAKLYDVSHATIRDVVQGRTWKGKS